MTAFMTFLVFAAVAWTGEKVALVAEEIRALRRSIEGRLPVDE